MNLKNIKRNSLTKKILIPTTTIMFLQMILIVMIISFGSIYNSLNKSSVNEYGSRVSLKSNFLQTNMLKNWGALENDVSSINDEVSSLLSQKGYTVIDMLSSSDKSTEVLSCLSDDVSLILRRNSVSESFIIFDSNTTSKKIGIYLRDNNPDSNFSGNIDMIVEYSPVSIRSEYMKMGYDSSSSYETSIDISLLSSDNFFSKPLNEAKKLETTDASYLAYWSSSTDIHGVECITYSIPLMINKQVYGVVGIGLSKTYFKDFADNYNTINHNIKDFNIFKRSDDNVSEIVVTNYNDSKLNAINLDSLKETKYDDLYEVVNDEISDNYYVYISCIDVYSDNTPFDKKEWYVAGLINKVDLFGANQETLKSIITVAFIALIVGVFLEIFICLIILRPVSNLTFQLAHNQMHKLEFKKVNIYEIDLLISKLQNYIDESLLLPDKLNRVINLANVKIGAFEVNRATKMVNITNNFYELLTIDDNRIEVSLEEFKAELEFLRDYVEVEKENEYMFHFPLKNRYVILKIVHIDSGVVGVLTDNTNEILDKIAISNERDLDVLTGLLNRRGFQAKIQNLFPLINRDKKTILIMIDIDNLKYINDRYGHDAGDKYIITTAEILRKYSSKNTIVSHISGDEFLVLIYDVENEIKIDQIIESIRKDISEARFEIFGEQLPIHLSAGLAYYDKSVEDYDELRRRADFAMYDVKTTTKNGFKFFNMQKYIEHEHNLKLFEKFNKLISEQLMDYYFQPIVDVHDASILGYEALMRPKMAEFKSPMDVLNVAKSNKRLSNVERLTFFKGTEDFLKQNSDKLLFINSLASQSLSVEDSEMYINQFKDVIGSRLVVEITEEELVIQNIMEKKRRFIDKIGASFAIDDYGTGYNTVSMLMNFDPKYVKIEGSFVRGIDYDEKKKKMTASIIDYCKENGIKVIAESVETMEEFKMVKQLGIDYVQGWFVSKPIKDIKPLDEEIINKIIEG